MNMVEYLSSGQGFHQLCDSQLIDIMLCDWGASKCALRIRCAGRADEVNLSQPTEAYRVIGALLEAGFLVAQAAKLVTYDAPQIPRLATWYLLSRGKCAATGGAAEGTEVQ
jgi:hypothetical protein